MLYDCRTAADRDRGVEAAIEAVKRGDLIVLPTDTLYGIGADAFKAWAVNALLDAKGRKNSPPVLVGSRATLDGLVYSLPSAARDLVEAFWPGALTVVVEHATSLQWDLGNEDGTVAVRMPLHAVALEILRETGPLAVSSANMSGSPAATSAEDAQKQLGSAIAVYLDGGPTEGPMASTIIDLTGDVPRLLRAGVIPV